MKATSKTTAVAQTKQATVYVIDEDPPARHALKRLLRSTGFAVCAFPDADAFLRAGCPPENACVVADVGRQAMSGLELQRQLKKAGSPLHFVFLAAQDMEETRAEAIRAGGAAFFVKPVDDQALFDAIQWALTLRREQSEGVPPVDGTKVLQRRSDRSPCDPR